MIKFLNKYLDFKLINSAAVFAVLYLLLFDFSVVFHKINAYEGPIFSALIEAGKELFCVYIALFLLFFGLLIHRMVFISLSVVLFLTGAAASYYLFFFGIAPDLKMMPVIYGTNVSEASELISTRLIIWVIFSLGICLYSIMHFKIQNTKSFITRVLMAVCLLISINNVIRPYLLVATYYPFQYLHGTYIYFLGDEEQKERENITNKFSFSEPKEEEVIGVLVIGESARYKNFGIYGYERDTTLSTRS